MQAELQAILDRITSTHRDCGDSKKICDGQTNIRNFRGKYNLKAEEAEKHRQDILRIEDSQDLCRGCDGTKCKHTGSFVGVIELVTPSKDGMFHSSITFCKWEKLKRKQQRIANLFQCARVPKAYASDRWSDYIPTAENQKAVAAAKWAATAGKGHDISLFIYGPRGTGKTKLAAIIANEKAHSGQEVLFSSVPDLLEDIRQSYKTNTRAETMQAARDTPCLILDDLGAEHITEWVGVQLFTLVNYRYNESLQTIITTNYDTAELAERLTVYTKGGEADDTQAQRILSRIYGMCKRIYLGGKDWRQVGNAG